VYLNTSTNKIHTITSNVNYAWYHMVSSSTHMISMERSGMISIPPPVRRQVHGTIVVKPQLVSHNLTYWPYHITHPTAKKVRQIYFIFCMFTWLLGLSHKNHFLPMNMKPQHWSMNFFFDSPLRVLRCRRHIHYSWRTCTWQATFIRCKPYVSRGTSLAWNA
jgi:hypothetical protein